MTLNDIKKKFATAAQKKTTQAAAIEELKKQLEKVTADKLAAADHGDLDKYKALDAQARDLDANIFVLTRSLTAFDKPVPVEDIKKAWHDYAKDYSANARKAYSEYLKACITLTKIYKNLADGQSIALAERAKAAEMIGEAPQTLDMFMLPTGNRPGLNKRSYWNFPELEFAYKMGCMSDQEAQDYVFMLNGTTPAQGVGFLPLSTDNLNWTKDYL